MISLLFIQMVKNAFGFPVVAMVSHIPVKSRMAINYVKEGRRPLLADLMRILKTTITSLPQVFICIDALDECLPKNLRELLESLRDIVREFPKTRIFITGRPHVGEDIQRDIPEAVAIPIRPNQNDIRNYVVMRLDRDIEHEAMSDDLRVEIVKTILDKMSNMCVGASPLPTMYTY